VRRTAGLTRPRALAVVLLVGVGTVLGLHGATGERAVGAAPAAPAAATSPSVFDEHPGGPVTPRSDPALRARFLAEYEPVPPDRRRAVLASYVGSLGVAGILDALEARYPNCHDHAHELGKAAYALTRDMPAVLQACSTRCVSGCMHGVLMEAFTEKPETLRARVATLCDEPAMRRIHKRGDCVHGVGHGVAYVTGYDMKRALTLCEAVGERAYQYYCASGAYMQFFMTFEPKIATRADHYPCDEASRFAAACYRYEVFFIAARLSRQGKGLPAIVAECLALPSRVQPACFHGLGHASVGLVAASPARIREVCEHGAEAARWLCIQGVVEKLAELDQPLATRVCAELQGGSADVCREAARNKLYATRKAGLEYYFVGY
jgi:hypothetical protein